MKKVLLSIALLGSFSLSAADISKLTSAVLDNNVRKVKSDLRGDISVQELRSLHAMAMQKNEFYTMKLRNWKRAADLAIGGAGLATVLGAAVGAMSGAIVGESRRPIVDVGIGFVVGAIAGAGAGGATGGALIAWTNRKVQTWQKLASESDRIVELINDKLDDAMS